MIALSGEANRKIFFANRSLDVQGYQIFMGGAPNLHDIDVNKHESGVVTEFTKRVSSLLHRDRVIEGATNTYCFIAEN